MRIIASVVRLASTFLLSAALAHAQEWVPIPRPGLVIPVNATVDRAGNRYSVSASGHELLKA